MISQGPQELCSVINQQDHPDVEFEEKLPPSVVLKGTFDPTVQTESVSDPAASLASADW